MGTETNKDVDRNSPEYLAQLLKDRKQIQAFPNVFLHLERILDDEINKVRGNLFHLNTNKEPLTLPDGQGPPVSLSEKLYVPVKQHPDFNFVGRILGPRGMTAKQLEQDTGCKIMVRGKGSMRDKKKEELNRGKPNWEHLNEELHVLITVEDTTNRAEMKIRRAVDEVRKLLVPAPEGEDDLKKRQLMELAIINGTYRDTTKAVGAAQQNPAVPQTMTHYLGEELAKFGQARTIMTSQHSEAPRMIGPPLAFPPHLRSPTPAGAPIILAPRMPTIATSAAHHAGLLNGGGPPPLVSPADAGLIYSYADPYGLAGATPILEYPGSVDHSAAGAVPKVRRTVAGMREHPYQRVSLA